MDCIGCVPMSSGGGAVPAFCVLPMFDSKGTEFNVFWSKGLEKLVKLLNKMKDTFGSPHKQWCIGIRGTYICNYISQLI